MNFLQIGGLRPFFAANDLCADGALGAIREAGLRVPQDIAVIGYDDTWYATMTRPQLTSVSMPIHEMGVAATQMLIAQVEGREVPVRQPVLAVRLTVRATPPTSNSSITSRSTSEEERAMLRRKSAFTLIELLVVIAIIAILAAISVSSFRQGARKSTLVGQLPQQHKGDRP